MKAEFALSDVLRPVHLDERLRTRSVNAYTRSNAANDDCARRRALEAWGLSASHRFRLIAGSDMHGTDLDGLDTGLTERIVPRHQPIRL